MNMKINNSIKLILMATIMFFIGRQSISIIQEPIVNTDAPHYTIEANYIIQDVDYQEEAIYIKKTFKSNMSTSKIKHLLIYIHAMCQHYDLNYNLVKSVISTESGWKYNAKSSAGAIGLMQIMKACAKDYKTPHSEMYDPYVNVTIGIKYLSKLTKQFDNTLTALVGYNEGPRYAKNYKEDYIVNSRYVTKVMNYLDSFDTSTELAGI
jgi:soluble lytic murein transglycosylase-like protein